MLFSIFQRGNPAEYIFAEIIAYILALLMALILHEVAHGFAALKCGDPSAKIAGRLSLNPAKHLDPIGTLCMLLAGIGWAKPVPVNPFNYRNFRKGNFIVSIAGITVNFILGIIFSLGLFFVVEYADITNVFMFALYGFLMYATIFNFLLMVFNLLPIYPLDGYNMLVSLTKPTNRYMQFMRQNAMVMLPILLLVLMFTGVLGMMAEGIQDAFLRLWGLIF